MKLLSSCLFVCLIVATAVKAEDSPSPQLRGAVAGANTYIQYCANGCNVRWGDNGQPAGCDCPKKMVEVEEANKVQYCANGCNVRWGDNGQPAGCDCPKKMVEVEGGH